MFIVQILVAMSANLVLQAVVCFLFALPIMLLWNWLGPELLNFGRIDYLQTFGVLLLGTLVMSILTSNKQSSKS